MADCEQCAALQRQNDLLANDRDGYVQLLTDDNNKLRAEVSELNQLFDARWSADMRAIECWRKVHPGNELVLPDHANLCLWLMEERTRLTAEVERLLSALHEAADELDACYRAEYPGDHPYSKRKLADAMRDNPARAITQEKPNDKG